VDHRVERVASGGPEVGADGVGDRDQRRLHHRLERDPEEFGRLALVAQVEGRPDRSDRRELNLTEIAVREWVKRADLDAGRRTGGLTFAARGAAP
jgi:hypothetical protein